MYKTINGFDELAAYLHFKDKRRAMDFARKFLRGKRMRKSKIPFAEEMVFDVGEVEKTMRGLYDSEYESLSFEDAALCIGIKADSFNTILHNETLSPIHSRTRFLAVYLDEFIDTIIEKYSQGKKKYPILFTDITNHRKYFIESYNSLTCSKIEMQKCEIINCDNVAYQQCSNKTDCRIESRRKICVPHGYMIRSEKPLKYHPDVICLECAIKNRKNGGPYIFWEPVESVDARIKKQGRE